jgi:hypothetical protein
MAAGHAARPGVRPGPRWRRRWSPRRCWRRQPPALADMAAWTAIAAKFAAFLPKPLPGWKATSVVKRVSNAAFHKSIDARQVYRPVKSRSPASWKLPLFEDAAEAKDRADATRPSPSAGSWPRSGAKSAATSPSWTVFLFAKRATAAQVEAYLPRRLPRARRRAPSRRGVQRGLCLTASRAGITSTDRLRGGVAQSVRALACHARGRGFESRHSRHAARTRSTTGRARQGTPVSQAVSIGRGLPPFAIAVARSISRPPGRSGRRAGTPTSKSVVNE